MSKIVQAVNAMISNKDKISGIVGNGQAEFFFLYDRKHKWSILRRSGGIEDYTIFYYPTSRPLNELADFEPDDWQDFDEIVSYSTKEIGTREALQSFRALFLLIKEMRFGIDEALDEIIDGF